MLLLELATEVLYLVIEHIGPDTIAEYASSCTVIRKLCQIPLRNHFLMKTKYSTIHINGRGSTPASIFQIVHDFASNPTLFLYPRKLIVEYVSPHWPLDRDGDVPDAYVEYFNELRHLKHELATMETMLSSWPGTYSKEEWTELNESIKDGKESPLVVFLFRMLPHLKSVVFHSFDRARLEDMFMRLIAPSMKVRLGSYSELQSIKLQSHSNVMGGRNDFPALSLLAALPSIKNITLCGLNLGGPGYGLSLGPPGPEYDQARDEIGDLTGITRPSPSNLERIFLEDTCLSPSRLFQLLLNFPNLKHFRYLYNTSIGNLPRHVLDICKTLHGSQFCLRSLDISPYHIGYYGYPGSLCHFVRLQSATISYSIIDKNDLATVVPKLVEMFPPSIEHITIKMKYEEPISDMLTGFRTEQFPKLHDIIFIFEASSHASSTSGDIGLHELHSVWSSEFVSARDTQCNRTLTRLNHVLRVLQAHDLCRCPLLMSYPLKESSCRPLQEAGPFIGVSSFQTFIGFDVGEHASK